MYFKIELFVTVNLKERYILLDSKNRSSKITNKSEFIHNLHKQWIPVSLVLLSLISGGSLINHAHAASNHYQPAIHTYRLINFTPGGTANEAPRQVSPAVQQRSYQATQTENRAPSNKTYPLYNPNTASTRNLWIKPVASKIATAVNQLRPYQIGNYGGQTITRTVMPFDQARINRPVQLHTSIFFNQGNANGTVNNCTVHILKSFNQYYNGNVYIRFMVNVNHQNYYITGNPGYVSFVPPSYQPDYYQHKIIGLLDGPDGSKLGSIRNSLNDLNAINTTDYQPYINLYLNAYNLVQEMHPVSVNVAPKVNKTTPLASNAASQENQRASQEVSDDLQKDLHLINSYNMVAATYDRNTMNQLSKIRLSSGNESRANYLESSILSEINNNNDLINQLNRNTRNVINNLSEPLNMTFEIKEVTFQIEMAQQVANDAERIYNTDYQQFVHML